MRVWLGVLLLLGLVSSSLHAVADIDEHGHYTEEFALRIEGGDLVADLVAKAHGFVNHRKIRSLDNVYIFKHPNLARRSKRSADDYLSQLKSDPNVLFVEQQVSLKRVKRSIVHDKQRNFPIHYYPDKSVYKRVNVNAHTDKKHDIKDRIPGPAADDIQFTDPHFEDQWQLVNRGQTGGPAGNDVNVMPVWKKGITGKGIKVTVLDDGIEHTHPDLSRNYDPEASADFNSEDDDDPFPDERTDANNHGTRCAGEIAAEANNDVCGVGIAYDAKVGGVRILDGRITDALEAEAINFNMSYIDIYSASWGPTDDGRTLEKPGPLCTEALKNGALNGRNGLGNLFIWATGNGGGYNDTCSCDGYVSSIYSLSIGCINDEGLSTYFSEICPATMAVIYTGGSHHEPGSFEFRSPSLKITTTDIREGCTLEFQGTSSAAPLAAGAFALVLQANPALTWRDVQHIVPCTAGITANETGWFINGAGFHVNAKFGFGVLDVAKMVVAAQRWETAPEQHMCESAQDEAGEEVPCAGTLTRYIKVNGCHGDKKVNYLEHVEMKIVVEGPVRGHINLFLTSPQGTTSEMLRIRPHDKSDKGVDFTFMSVQMWGEDPQGDWMLEVFDRGGEDCEEKIKLVSWELVLWGTEEKVTCPSLDESTESKKSDKKADSTEAHEPKQKELVHIKQKEDKAAENIVIGKKDLDNLSDNELGEIIRQFDARDLENFLRQVSETEKRDYKDTVEKRTYSDIYRKRKEELEQEQEREYKKELVQMVDMLEKLLDEEGK